MNDHQVIVFLVFGVIAFLNWLMRKGSGGMKGDKGSPPFTPPRRQPPSRQSEEERLRKFMEALGVPTVVEPPRKMVRPQPVPELPRRVPIPTSPVPPLPRRATPAVIPVKPAPEPVAFEPVTETPAENAVYAVSVAPENVEPIQSAPVATEKKTERDSDLRALLKSKSSVRNVMVLREILGPCRGLQPLEEARGLL